MENVNIDIISRLKKMPEYILTFQFELPTDLNKNFQNQLNFIASYHS